MPVTDDLFASLLVGTTNQDGYIYNTTLDRDLQGINRDVAKLKFRFVGIESLLVDIGFGTVDILA